MADPTDAQRAEIARLARRLGRQGKGIQAPRSDVRAQALIARLNEQLAKKTGRGQRRKAGATGTRLTYTSAPSAEIRERQRKTRQASAVTVRWEEPSRDPKRARHRKPKRANLELPPPRPASLEGLEARLAARMGPELARRAGVQSNPQTRHEPSAD